MPKVFFYKINRNYQSLHKYWHDIINVRLKLESRNQKRKEFVEAIVIRNLFLA